MISKKVGCLSAYHTICVNIDGTLDPCCQYQQQSTKPRYYFTDFEKYQLTTQQEIHNDNVSGTPHVGCSKCYTEEARNWPALRTHFQNWYGKRSLLNFGKEPPDAVKSTNPIYHIELRLGNVCNLKCLMCSPGSSSLLAQERAIHKDKFHAIGIFTDTLEIKNYWETPEFLTFSKFILSNAQHINVTGGEPFIIPEVPKFLDQLMHKKDTVELSFNTNLTKLYPLLISKLQQFKKLAISVSLEGIESKNEYIRYPSKWKDIKKNIEIIKKQIPSAKLSVNHTFQHSSVYALPELAEYCHNNNLYIHLTLVQGEEALTLSSVPESDLNKFKLWVDSTELLDTDQKQLISNTIQNTTYDLKLHKKYCDYVLLLDEIRGTDYYNVFNTETKYGATTC